MKMSDIIYRDIDIVGDTCCQKCGRYYEVYQYELDDGRVYCPNCDRYFDIEED